MPPVKPRHRRWILLAALFWFGLMLLVWWFGNRVSPAWFDPARIAPHAFHEPANVKQLLDALKALEPETDLSAPLFIRFSQPDCPCERLVENYHLLLTPTLQKQGLQVIDLTPDRLEQIAHRLGRGLRE